MKIDTRTKIISVFLLSSACFTSEKVLPVVILFSLAAFIYSKGIRIQSLKFALPVLVFSFFVFIFKAVSYQKGIVFNMHPAWILPVKIFVSSFLGFLMILSTDTLSLSKAVSFVLRPLPLIKHFGVNTIIALSASNIKLFSTIWSQKYNAVRSRSSVFSLKLIISFSFSMITTAFRHAEETAFALESRNYTGEFKSDFTSMKFADYAVILFSITAFLYSLCDYFMPLIILLSNS